MSSDREVRIVYGAGALELRGATFPKEGVVHRIRRWLQDLMEPKMRTRYCKGCFLEYKLLGCKPKGGECKRRRRIV
jgi:hypothetical protein